MASTHDQALSFCVDAIALDIAYYVDVVMETWKNAAASVQKKRSVIGP